MSDEDNDIAEFLKSRGKTLPTPKATPKKRTPKTVAVIAIPVFTVGDLVKVKRACQIDGHVTGTRSMPAGKVGKVTKAHTEYNPPRWYTVSFPHPSESDPFVTNLIVGDLDKA